MNDRYSDMRGRITGDTWLDELARASVDALSTRRRRIIAPDPFLVVNIGVDLDATTLTTVTKNVQNAVARVGHLIVDQRTDADRVLSSDLTRTPLFPLYNQHRRIIFGFTAPPSEDPTALFPTEPGHVTIAERAAAELLQVLPSNADDFEALETILGRARATRNAVRDLATTASATMGMNLLVHGREELRSTLTQVQASTLAVDLAEETEYETEQFSVQGKLDGARMRRRIFYFEGRNQDYQGGYDPDLAATVRNFIDLPARAGMERIRRKKLTGTPGRWTYRLLSLSEPGATPSDPGLF